MKLKWYETLAICLLKGIGHLSFKNIYRLSVLIYYLTRPFPLRLRKTIHRNLERCLPDLSEIERAKLTHQAVHQTFLRVLEMPFFWFGSLRKRAALHLEVTGEDIFSNEFAKGQGAIVITAHFGCWEMNNAYLGPKYPCATLYKPLRDAYQEELVRIARERYGVEFLETSMGGVKKIFAALKAGKFLAIMSDHDPGDHGGMMVPFFGIPANTSILPIKLIQKSKAPVYCLSAERLPKGQGFHLRFKKLEGLRDVSVEEAALKMNQAIEAIARQNLAQFEWSYKRFRRTAGFYD